MIKSATSAIADKHRTVIIRARLSPFMGEGESGTRNESSATDEMSANTEVAADNIEINKIIAKAIFTAISSNFELYLIITHRLPFCNTFLRIYIIFSKNNVKIFTKSKVC